MRCGSIWIHELKVTGEELWQAKERAKSRAALMEMLPRKRSSRVATKEEREKEEEEKRLQREAELAQKKAEEEKKRKERERQQLEKARQEELAARAKAEEREKAFEAAERERRLRKRRRFLAKQARQAAHAEALQEQQEEGEWWEVGNHVEVFSEEDWWQAVILKNRGGNNGEELMIYIAFIGGTEEDNEWLPITSVRVRKPQEDFWDNGGESDDDMDAERPSPAINMDRKARGANGGGYSAGGRASNGLQKQASARSDTRSVKPEMSPANQATQAGFGSRLPARTQAEGHSAAVHRLPESSFKMESEAYSQPQQHAAQLPQLSRQMHNSVRACSDHERVLPMSVACFFCQQCRNNCIHSLQTSHLYRSNSSFCSSRSLGNTRLFISIKCSRLSRCCQA
jgi:hypothetical protein